MFPGYCGGLRLLLPQPLEAGVCKGLAQQLFSISAVFNLLYFCPVVSWFSIDKKSSNSAFMQRFDTLLDDFARGKC